MNCEEIIFSAHAVQRMFARGIQVSHIKAIIEFGEIVADYPDDLPYPSYLILGWVGNQPMHVVVAIDRKVKRCYVVTAYLPDPVLWSLDFKTRI
jgi:hypothetical protein